LSLFWHETDLKLKDEIVFDIVKSILDQSYVAPVQLEIIAIEVPQTPRSPIRPVDDRPRRRATTAAAATQRDKVQNTIEDKENVMENDISTAVAQLKFEPIIRTRRGRTQQNM
jgi:hypothetical protein